MKYIISGNDTDGYVIAGSDGKTNYNACPCCLKPITTFRRATLIAQGLETLDAHTDALNTKLQPKE